MRTVAVRRPPVVIDVSAFAALVPEDHGLCVLSTLRPDGGVHATVVNAGVLPHPVTGDPVVGVVVAGNAGKLRNLRADPRATVVVRAGWRWAAVEGTAELVGPDDPHPGLAAGALPGLLRAIFTAAGGTHDDWDAFDRTMVEERRAAVLVTPVRTYTNPGG
jgi:PPOX class probable F420-dependent enzyme